MVGFFACEKTVLQANSVMNKKSILFVIVIIGYIKLLKKIYFSIQALSRTVQKPIQSILYSFKKLFRLILPLSNPLAWSVTP